MLTLPTIMSLRRRISISMEDANFSRGSSSQISQDKKAKDTRLIRNLSLIYVYIPLFKMLPIKILALALPSALARAATFAFKADSTNLTGLSVRAL